MSNYPAHWCKIWRKTDLFSKMTRIWWILTRALKVSKICTFIGSYCAKYLMFDLKKYTGVIFDDTEEWCKIWRKTDLCFGKWHEKFGKFSLESVKIGILMGDPFVQSRKYMSLKFTEELCVMTKKNDKKWKRNWLAILKLNLTRALKSLKQIAL